MDPRQQQQLKQYLNILLRWKKTIIACFLLGLAGGLTYYAVTPKSYQASALLIYQRQKINPSKMSPDLQEKGQDIIATLKQQVLSRNNLEEIIKQYDLYPELRQRLPLEDVIDRMRGRDITVEEDKKGDTFWVRYEGAEPRKTMLVTNAIAAKFVEENLRFREERATETTAYVQDELAMAQKALEEKEQAMRDYKLAHYNEMPDQQATNISRLNALQASLQNLQASMQELERTKIMVQEQITLRNNLLQQAANDETASLLPGGPSPEERELARLQAELTDLLTRYTEAHPEVKRTRKRIAALEEQLAAAPAATDTGTTAAPLAGRRTGDLPGKNLTQLELQLKDIDLSMAQLKKEAEEIRKQMATYQEWINAAPVREAEWAALTRDYQQLQTYYQGLVSRSLEASSAESLEKRQKGSQFRIVDPARLPETPYKPNLKKIMLLAVALGLGLGCGLAFGLEALDTSFKDANDLEAYLELPILCSVPVLPTAAEKRRARMVGLFWLLLFIAALVALAGAVVILYRRGILVL